MKFALVNGDKTEAQPGLRRGACIFCQSETIAKCGSVKIWHWAHKSKIPCDPWWENETGWHRKWKKHFPPEWQEIRHADSVSGERHIADIKTASGLIVEFQYSAIRPEEIQRREKFYKDMVWVVNGTRLKNNYPHFCKGFSNLRPLKNISGIFLSLVPQACFPASWLNSSVPIYLDFQDSNPANQRDGLRSPLWCLFPGRAEGYAVVAGVPREDFIRFCSEAPQVLFARQMLSNISQVISERKNYPQTTPSRQYVRSFRRLRLK